MRIMIANYSYIGIWNMEFTIPKKKPDKRVDESVPVVFYYEPEDPTDQGTDRGFHWHCENNEIELELVSQCI